MGSIKKRWGVALVLAMTISIAGCQKQGEQAPELMEPVSVGTATSTVVRQDIFSADTIDVSVVPVTQELYFTMDGKIRNIAVNEGQMVEEGQTLAVIDQSDLLDKIQDVREDISFTESKYTYQLEQANDAIQIAQLQYEKLQDQYQKLQSLQAQAEEAARISATNPLVQSAVLWLPAEMAEDTTETGQEGESTGNTEESSLSPEESSEDSEGSSESGDSSDSENSSGHDSSGDSSESSVPEESQDSSNSSQNSGPVVQPSGNTGGITEYQLTQAQLDVQQAQLEYQQKQEEYNQKLTQQHAQLQSLLNKVGDDTVKAPCSGRIVKLNYNEGDWAEAYKVVMILADENQMMLRGGKYSNSSLKMIETIDVLINGRAYAIQYMPYDDDEYFQAALNKVSLPSRFLFTDEPEVRFGESGTVRVYRSYSKDALVLPSNCVMEDDMGSFVYKVAGEDRREKVYVTVGVSTDANKEIVSGLEEGDEVYGRE